MRRRSSPIVFALAADWLVGDPRRHHPVAGFGITARYLEARLWRPSRGAGVVYASLLVGGVAIGGALANAIVPRRWHPALQAVVLWSAIAQRSLLREAAVVRRSLESGDIAGARSRLGNLVGRDREQLAAPDIVRATIESVAENTTDAVVAPLMWAAIGGTPAVAAYRAANTLDAMVGHRDARYEQFGWAAARLDDVMTWPAARVAALLAVLVAPVAGGRRRLALAAARDGRAHPSPNAGLIESVFAGALDVRLGGPNAYGGLVEVRPQLGRGRAPTTEDIRRSTRLSAATGLAAALLCALVSRGL